MSLEAAPPSHVYEIFIKAAPEQVWRAIIDPDVTQRYMFGSRVESTWEVGSSYAYPDPKGGIFHRGEILEVDPPRRLRLTFDPIWDGKDHGISEVTYILESRGELTKLRLEHRDRPNMPFGTHIDGSLIEGWAMILSGLKTALETGQFGAEREGEALRLHTEKFGFSKSNVQE